MIVEPYKLRPVAPALALLREDATIVDERGQAINPGRIPKGVQVWASQERVTALLRAGVGSALCWRGQPIRYCLRSQYDVRILALPFPDDEKALAGLGRWRDWLASAGASPLGTLGSSSMSLLRSILEAPLWTSVPFASCPPIRFTLGGRQELGPAGAPAAYTGQLRHFDMRAAYPRTLARLEYGGHWFRLHERRLDAHAELCDRGGRMVFCRARVRLAGSAPGPLVRRPRAEPQAILGFEAAYPAEGTLQGIWTYPELRAAQETGASVHLLEGWMHTSGQWRPFERWWREVEQGRRMHGFAGTLAKATGSALWGQFCISRRGRRQLLFYDRRGRRVIRELPTTGGRKPAHDLAEYLTGSVRAELYRFLVAAGGRLCCAHTDGGWVDCAGGWAYPAWRSKERAEALRVLDPQLLAYRIPGEQGERYVVSGWPAEGAADLFEREWTERTAAAA